MELDKKQTSDSSNSSNQVSLYSIGKAKFAATMSKREIYSILGQKKIEMLQRKKWDGLYPNQWENEKFELLFKCIKSTSNSSLHISLGVMNQKNFILLPKIKFQKLMILKLSLNNIENIESLIFLDAPMIKSIGISYNYITTVSKNFSKFHLKTPKSINLEYNPIAQVQMSRFTSCNPEQTIKVNLHILSINIVAKMDSAHGDVFFTELFNIFKMQDNKKRPGNPRIQRIQRNQSTQSFIYFNAQNKMSVSDFLYKDL